MLGDINPKGIHGITAMHGLRISAREGASSSETGVDFHYVEHFSNEGSTATTLYFQLSYYFTDFCL